MIGFWQMDIAVVGRFLPNRHSCGRFLANGLSCGRFLANGGSCNNRKERSEARF